MELDRSATHGQFTPFANARSFAPPGDSFLLSAESSEIRALADRLWPPGPGSEVREPRARFRVSVAKAASECSTVGESWRVDPPHYLVSYGDRLETRIDTDAATVDAWVGPGLLRTDPYTASRLLLEAPAAILLATRAWQPLHAAAIVGTTGAVVVRGGNGAGKSTLAARAFRDGLQVFGDESILVHREAPHRIAVAVRELLIRPDAAQLVRPIGPIREVLSGDERKLRLAMDRSPTPVARETPHKATLLLGDRDRSGGALLTPIGAEEFVLEFAKGEIPQERLAGCDPDRVARAWAAGPTFRLDGHRDLSGAIGALRGLLENAI
ncbi:MAG: hypothetical protein CME06_06540 [Gemmatimonadetes bacterium]|nr:hypothetical protein [Gemmatimonadota bacterium]